MGSGFDFPFAGLFSFLLLLSSLSFHFFLPSFHFFFLSAWESGDNRWGVLRAFFSTMLYTPVIAHWRAFSRMGVQIRYDTPLYV
ncbi:hypothetical protein QBC33DRAFT_535522 [Phialemonium atrogriseum]|uniref:Uncharacterized protein n=1 Tax=Phialemonium atrogriseum TaxID=1093897 RepID=A0AAJ0FPY0_9PEZI|nr:uncharacterized protein QBC33DRAFT_535522 [Phialemonium atrogriseum]KAK1768600.1 hypothetical protein QBC33DRAFT_535522 [Phialemonium atrogriseum]